MLDEMVGVRTWLARLYRALLPCRVRRYIAGLIGRYRYRKFLFPRTAAWSRLVSETPVTQVGDVASKSFGVNIAGYLTAQFGLGESAWAYANALRSQGVAVSLFDLDIGIPHDRNVNSGYGKIDQELLFPTTLLFVNPDYLDKALAAMPIGRSAHHHLIACWFWELEKLPRSWVPAIQRVDGVMAATHFIASAVGDAGNVPVLRVPLPLVSRLDGGLQRLDFGIDPQAFVFLFTFDFSSWIERKNPVGVIRAFKHAFPAGQPAVQLVLKSSNGHRHEAWFSLVLAEIAGDPRILLRDDIIDRPHLVSLQRCADAYVSLHRAEGLGMGMAECMALGKPVIATGWSGNLDFMDGECAALIGYTLVPVPEGGYPDAEGQRWAEPSVAEAAIWMRRLAECPQLSRELGERGRQHVEKMLSPEASVRNLLSALDEIGLISKSPNTNKSVLEGNP